MGISVFLSLTIDVFNLLVLAITAPDDAFAVLLALDPLSRKDSAVSILENALSMLFIILK